MNTRRDALRTLAAAAAFPILQGQEQIKIFSADDFQLLTKLVDAIIPQTDTPGASEAGVPRYIDYIAVSHKETARALLKGLADLREAGFADASPAQTIAILTKLNDSADSFFRLAKDLTIDGYYASRQGLVAELGYHGDTFLSEFPGCTHPEHHADKT